MEDEGKQAYPPKDDLEKGDRLTQVIGKLIQTASFIEWCIEMSILGRVPGGLEVFVKPLLNGTNSASKMDALEVLLRASKTEAQMREWEALRKGIKEVFEDRNVVAHGVFGRRVCDDGYVVHRLRTGKSGKPIISYDHGIDDVQAACQRALEIQVKLVQFLYPTPMPPLKSSTGE